MKEIYLEHILKGASYLGEVAGIAIIASQRTDSLLYGAMVYVGSRLINEFASSAVRRTKKEKLEKSLSDSN